MVSNSSESRNRKSHNIHGSTNSQKGFGNEEEFKGKDALELPKQSGMPEHVTNLSLIKEQCCLPLKGKGMS